MDISQFGLIWRLLHEWSTSARGVCRLRSAEPPRGVPCRCKMSSDGAAESKTGGAADAPGGSEAGSADEERRAYPAADVRELVGQVESLVAMWRKACDSGGEALTALANAAITGGYFNDRQLPTLPPALLEDLASHVRGAAARSTQPCKQRCADADACGMQSLRKVDEHADALRSCFEDVVSSGPSTHTAPCSALTPSAAVSLQSVA